MRAAKSGASLLCLGVVLFVQTMVAVPAFHAWIHHDARESGHECAVTLILSGQVHSSTTEVAAARPQPVPVSHAPARGVDFVSTDVCLLPGRGPPA